MAKITLVDLTDNPDGEVSVLLRDEYTKLADLIEKEVGEDLVFDLVIDQPSDVGFSVTLSDRSKGIAIARSIRIGQNGRFEHDLFELPGDLQGKGIARHVMQTSLNLTEQLGIESIELDANLDVGGYAWLRRGALPMGGKQELLDLFSDAVDLNADLTTASTRTRLATELFKTLEPLDGDELREYLFSPEFQQYKPLFLESAWGGRFDVTNGAVRAAMVDGANAGFKVATGRRAPNPNPTINERIGDAYTRRQVYLLQYAQNLSNRAYESVSATDKAVINEVREQLEDVINLGLANPKTQAVLKELEAAITEIRLAGWDTANELIESEMYALTGIEASAAVTIIDGAIPAVLNMKMPPPKRLRQIVDTYPFEGKTLKQWLRRTENADIDRITNNVKIGLTQGETLPQIVQRLRGVDDIDGVMNQSRNNVEALTRTVVNGIQHQSKQALYDENRDVVDKEYFLATLDIRTTLICASNDGEVFDVGEGPMPPLHFGCRSLRVAYINPDNWANRGFDSSTEREFLRDFTEENNLSNVSASGDLPYGFKTAYTKYARQRRRELVGQVPATTTFNEWLRNQSEAFQNDYLGINRAEAFRSGKFKLDRFVAPDGSTLTLDELRSTGLNV